MVGKRFYRFFLHTFQLFRVTTRKLPAREISLAVALSLLCGLYSFAQNPSFTPDKVFQGSSLANWRVVGPAKWQAQNGVITADARNSKNPGWLFLDHSLQDAGVYISFKCAGACDTGVLLRAEKQDIWLTGMV